MKRFLLPLILAVMMVHSVAAQDIDQLIKELSKAENVDYQIMDKETLDQQMDMAIKADPTGELKSKIPSFMPKIDMVEAVVSEDSSVEIMDKCILALANMENEDAYETLLKVKDGDESVHIIARKGEEKSDIYIVVIDEDDIIVVKMSGTLDEQDFMDIVEEQQKNRK